jgi:hypothetical protein
MSRRVFSICLALVLTSISYGLQPLEPPDGDWTVWDAPKYCSSEWYYWPEVATEGEWVLGLTPSVPGYGQVLSNTNMYQDLSLLSQPGARFLIDVTWVASEWSGDETAWARQSVIAIGGAPGWCQFQAIDTVNPSNPGTWDPYNYGEVHTRTLAYDVSGYDWAGVEGTGYLELVIAINDGGMTQLGTTYFDNPRIIPEPATLALLGLGALALFRRKR